MVGRMVELKGSASVEKLGPRLAALLVVLKGAEMVVPTVV